MRERNLKTTIERNVRALKLRPSTGRGTAVATVRANAGETLCEIEDGGWKLTADMSKDMGGGGAAPDPGVFLRSALGSCMLMGYRLWAARMDIPVDDITVTVETDYDASGMYGVDEDVAPGYPAVRCLVSVNSPAPAERVREMIEEADRHSPILDDMTRVVHVTRTIGVTGVLKVR